MFPSFSTPRPAPPMAGGRRPERTAAAAPDPRDVRQDSPSPPRSWRDRARRVVELTVAFILLDDAEPAPRSLALHVRARVPARRARPSVDAARLHRAPLRPSLPPRRPGAVAPRPQPCLSPVGSTLTARRTLLD